MNRLDLQRLAKERIADAAALLAAKRWSAAYYLSGYAVECAMKACIAKLMSAAMAQIPLVEMQVKDGQSFIERLVQEGIPVTAAAWVSETESGDWYLYIATPLVAENRSRRPAYRRVHAVLREMDQEEPGMDALDIKLIGAHEPIAKDLVAHRGTRPRRYPVRFRGWRLGQLPIDDAFIIHRSKTQKKRLAPAPGESANPGTVSCSTVAGTAPSESGP